MEIHLATPFQTLAKQCGIDLSSSSDDNMRFLQAFQVFKAYETDVPENSRLRSAVENCLHIRPSLWEDVDGKPYSTQDLRALFYQKVVRLLEDELEHAFSYISVERLDSFAPTVDFCNWGQIITNEKTSELSPLHSLAPPWRPSKETLLHNRAELSGEHQLRTLSNPTLAGYSLGSKRQKVGERIPGGTEATAIKFFDDEARPQMMCAKA
jgi:hypothetical protein